MRFVEREVDEANTVAEQAVCVDCFVNDRQVPPARARRQGGCRFHLHMADAVAATFNLSEIPLIMADAKFQSLWRILEPYGRAV